MTASSQIEIAPPLVFLFSLEEKTIGLLPANRRLHGCGSSSCKPPTSQRFSLFSDTYCPSFLCIFFTFCFLPPSLSLMETFSLLPIRLTVTSPIKYSLFTTNLPPPEPFARVAYLQPSIPHHNEFKDYRLHLDTEIVPPPTGCTHHSFVPPFVGFGHGIFRSFSFALEDSGDESSLLVEEYCCCNLKDTEIGFKLIWKVQILGSPWS
ncbi:hypothetical protein BUALT_Bualt02G0189000 [Buddleja alternifolia]|uniref:Uncharacterized protein n=1 Tax=Buddleja alternifolia TaxID=168488 RepID=A0AAV6YC67_9LAMI|nr:hypothetical protein BUALT_Bualt02G0189000 [Buddleja alternifolia]